MYCVKCGVELADSERKCPLCLTPVYMPGISDDPERPYPKFDKPDPTEGEGYGLLYGHLPGWRLHTPEYSSLVSRLVPK